METKKNEFKINMAAFPEAGAAEYFSIPEEDVTKVLPKTFRPFGEGPEMEMPVEWLAFCRKHIPEMLDKVYTDIQKLAETELDGANQESLVEWMEEDDFGYRLNQVVFNIAGLSGMMVKK